MSPFARWFQARVLRKEAGEAELLLEVREEFLQGQGLVHGGILAALLDSALGQAVESLGAQVVPAGATGEAGAVFAFIALANT